MAVSNCITSNYEFLFISFNKYKQNELKLITDFRNYYFLK